MLRNEIIRFVVLHPRYSLLEIMDDMLISLLMFHFMRVNWPLNNTLQAREPERIERYVRSRSVRIVIDISETGGNYQPSALFFFYFFSVSLCGRDFVE